MSDTARYARFVAGALVSVSGCCWAGAWTRRRAAGCGGAVGAARRRPRPRRGPCAGGTAPAARAWPGAAGAGGAGGRSRGAAGPARPPAAAWPAGLRAAGAGVRRVGAARGVAAAGGGRRRGLRRVGEVLDHGLWRTAGVGGAARASSRAPRGLLAEEAADVHRMVCGAPGVGGGARRRRGVRRQACVVEDPETRRGGGDECPMRLSSARASRRERGSGWADCAGAGAQRRGIS